MSDFEAKMHKKRFRLELCPIFCRPDLPAGFTRHPLSERNGLAAVTAFAAWRFDVSHTGGVGSKY